MLVKVVDKVENPTLGQADHDTQVLSCPGTFLASLHDAGHDVGDVVEDVVQGGLRHGASHLPHLGGQAGERPKDTQHRVQQHRQTPGDGDLTLQ